MKKTLLWDFDGTLVYSDKLWSRLLIKVLNKFQQGHNINIESIIKCIDTKGFPWHEPELDYTNLTQPTKWWEKSELVFRQAYLENNISPDNATFLAKQVRFEALDYTNYTLFEDSIPCLKAFFDKGYSNIILTNHMPEIEKVAYDIGLMQYMDACITSALVGYEKPRPEIFKRALEVAGFPETVYMIGDNPISDIWGAEKANIPAILVRNPCNFSQGKIHNFITLYELMKIL